MEALLRKVVPVSGKNDPVCPNSILLLPDKPTAFGRVISPETNVRLLSKNTPLMISRKHATVAFSAGKWTVVDHEVGGNVMLDMRDFYFTSLVTEQLHIYANILVCYQNILGLSREPKSFFDVFSR